MFTQIQEEAFYRTANIAFASFVKMAGIELLDIVRDTEKTLPNKTPIFNFVFNVHYRDPRVRELYIRWKKDNKVKEIKDFLYIYKDLKQYVDGLSTQYNNQNG